MYISAVLLRELVTQDKNSVNDEDESSKTTLHLAALAGHAKVAPVLIEMGADVAARYKNFILVPCDCIFRLLIKRVSNDEHGFK